MKMPFDVLDRSLDLRRNYLLEASAGTGKTFSIQNIVVRLLVEPRSESDPVSLDKILVVTFTRAATKDLKIRIRMNIEEALYVLNGDIQQNHVKIPDYLKACMEKGEQAVNLAKKRLQQALFLFDQAQIFTIHSFCSRMLRQFSMESDTPLHSSSGESPLPQSELKAIILDFFRTEIRSETFCPAQIEKYLSKDPDQKKLMKMMQSSHSFISSPSFEQILMKFRNEMTALKNGYSLTSECLIEDFQKQAPFYSNYSKESKIETFEKIVRFATLFDRAQWSREDLDGLIADGLVWAKALNPALIKKQPPKVNELYYPDLTQRLSVVMEPLIDEAGDFSLILARLADECRHYLHRFQNEEEKLSPDDVLRKMHQALDRPLFMSKVRANYQVVIVDEFQDTDPLQWQIFSRLFLSENRAWKGNLYLVGDPKQSIYSFRQADIYTYLKAAQEIGELNCLSLSVNYRSHAPLVQALNLLFCQEHLPSFIPLPKLASHLPCHEVKAAREGSHFEDEKGAVHFFIADCQDMKKTSLQQLEEDVFFPFIVNEINCLKHLKKLSFKDFAILVRDRNQALRLAEYLRNEGIPFLNQRGTNLARSLAHQAFSELIQALLHPRDRGKVLTVLGSPLFGWTQEEIKNPDSLEFIFMLIQQLCSSLKRNEFSVFFRDLLNTVCKPDGPTVLELMLSKRDGLEFYRDLQQIADCVADHQYVEWTHWEGILSFLDQFPVWEQNEDERVRRFEDPEQDGVKIITLHMSKGLEFEIVFALGLINRDSIKDDLIPIDENGKIILSSLPEDSAAYRLYCEERDSEKMRQLYVALTRAKFRLYVPATLHFPSKSMKWGDASPIDLFLARLHRPSASYPSLYERIRSSEGHSLIDFIDEIGKQHWITYSVHQKIISNTHIHLSPCPANELKEPPQIVVPGKALWITSFTTLSKLSEQVSHQPTVPSYAPPSDYGSSLKNVHTLPANSETGLLIHRILENISFHDFNSIDESSQAIPLIRPYVKHSVYQEWEGTIAQLVFNTLKAPLASLPSSFCFAHMEEGSFYREMPFLFPYQKGGCIEEVNFNEGLIKGVVDLLFCHEGRYYLVDWKTNWLGPQNDFYEHSFLHAAMRENTYFLQASIYAEAVKRFIKLVDDRPFKECFGGIYYLFLRGIEPGKSHGMMKLD